MTSSLSHRLIPAVLALALVPASAGAMTPKDYSKNGATGDVAPTVVHKNYALNGATGDYMPPSSQPAQPSVRIVRVADDSGFAWGAAGVGAAAVLLATLFAGVGSRRIRHRRITVPSPTRPTTV
jgi:hypothetical protein